MKRAFLILTACLLPPLVLAQSLGRLFHSEAERAQLELQRGQAVKPAAQQPAAGALRHDGAVVRSDGRVTWFVNGSPVDIRTLPSIPASGAGTALELPGSDGTTVKLRPGERTMMDESRRAAAPAGNIHVLPGGAR